MNTSRRVLLVKFSSLMLKATRKLEIQESTIICINNLTLNCRSYYLHPGIILVNALFLGEIQEGRSLYRYGNLCGHLI